MSRAYTAEEMRQTLLQEVKHAAHYWATLPNKTAAERCDGLAFTIMVIFDGGHLNIPGLDIVPAPAPEDQAFHEKNGENWWEPIVINECQLHEHYSRLEDI